MSDNQQHVGMGVYFSAEVDQVFAALAAAQADLRNTEKNRTGHNYKYADLAGILSDLRPVFSKHGLFVVQWPSPLSEEGQISISTMIGHSSGQWMKLGDCGMSLEANRGMSKAQAIGSVMTYARRYALQAALGISSTDDDVDAQRPNKYAGMSKMEIMSVVDDLMSQLDSERGHEPGTAIGKAIKWKGDQINRGRKKDSQEPFESLEDFTEEQLVALARGAEIQLTKV